MCYESVSNKSVLIWDESNCSIGAHMETGVLFPDRPSPIDRANMSSSIALYSWFGQRQVYVEPSNMMSNIVDTTSSQCHRGL